MENGIEIIVDADKVIDSGSIRDFIIENVSIGDYKAFCDDKFPDHILNSKHDVYIEATKDINTVYNSCKEEICDYSHPGDIEDEYGHCLEGADDHFDGIKAFQIDVCVREILKNIKEKYGAVIEKNPKAKNLKDVVGTDRCRFWYDEKTDFSKYKSLQDAIESNYSCKELLYEVKEKKRHGFHCTSVDGKNIYDKFHIEINKNGNFDKHKHHNNAQITETVVAEAIVNIVSNIYHENKEAIEKTVNLNVNVKKALEMGNSKEKEM